MGMFFLSACPGSVWKWLGVERSMLNEQKAPERHPGPDGKTDIMIITIICIASNILLLHIHYTKHERFSYQNGKPSPCVSVNWKAWTKRRVSSTERPTGKSFMVIWRSVPLSSIINRPLHWHHTYNWNHCHCQILSSSTILLHCSCSISASVLTTICRKTTAKCIKSMSSLGWPWQSKQYFDPHCHTCILSSFLLFV